MRAWILFLGLWSRWLRLSWGPWTFLGSMISSKFDVCRGACLTLWVLLVDKEMDWGISCIQGGWSQPSRESGWSQPLVPNALPLFTLMLFTLYITLDRIHLSTSTLIIHPHHSPSSFTLIIHPHLISPLPHPSSFFLPPPPTPPTRPTSTPFNFNAHILKSFCWIFLFFLTLSFWICWFGFWLGIFGWLGWVCVV